MQTIPDSNVVLDLLLADKDWRDWSFRLLAQCKAEGALVLTPIVFAEIAAEFRSYERAHDTISGLGFLWDDIPYEAAYLAGRAHIGYRARGGSRDCTLPDFLIGAHAAVKGYRLLTRDQARYRSYFPNLTIIAPDTHP